MDRAETEETFLTVAEVAEMLKLNQQTVRNWIDQGSLPALRVGRRVRIKRSDFDRILEDSYSGSSSSAEEEEAEATGAARTATEPAPSAQDFWDGEPVGIAEPAPGGNSASTSNSPWATNPAPAINPAPAVNAAPAGDPPPPADHNGHGNP